MSKRRDCVVEFQCLRSTRIAGLFTGYALGAIHQLEDRSCWRQVTDRTETITADQPQAWVYTDGNVCYLDVDGTHGVVEVAACVDPNAPMMPGLTSGRLLGG